MGLGSYIPGALWLSQREVSLIFKVRCSGGSYSRADPQRVPRAGLEPLEGGPQC